MGSRGSVIPFFLEKKKENKLPITDPNMTRFNISLEEGIELVFKVIGESLGGEIYVPKIPSYRILDVAMAIAPDAEHEITGIRPGEKIHEEMITLADSQNTIDIGDYYVILPYMNEKKRLQYLDYHKGRYVPDGFSYNSGSNSEWLGVEEIRKLIVKYIDPSFKA
jgi:FlaA1/EpsC-like NDP-sugar epimerase